MFASYADYACVLIKEPLVSRGSAYRRYNWYKLLVILNFVLPARCSRALFIPVYCTSMNLRNLADNIVHILY